MKILLTGATGFIGSAIARVALTRGHTVACLARSGKPLPASLSPHPNLRWISGTLEDPAWDDIAKFVADVCIHSAWITTPGVYLESPENYKFLENSVSFLRKVNESGTNQIVGLGTCVEYKISNEKLSEDKTPIAPATTYAKCKNELRQTVEADSAKHGFNFAWARVFYPYGPGEHPSRLFSSIIQKLSRGEKIVLKTPNSAKDYIFIEDLAEAVMAVVEKRFQGAINLGTGVGIPVREIAREIAVRLNRPDLVTEANPPETDPLGNVVADNTRLRGLGWTQKWDLQSGIKALLTGENLPPNSG